MFSFNVGLADLITNRSAMGIQQCLEALLPPCNIVDEFILQPLPLQAEAQVRRPIAASNGPPAVAPAA